MEPVDPPRSSGHKTLIIILAIVAGGGLALLLCCGGCGYWVYRSYVSNIPLAEASANAFLDDLQAGRVDAAYASTSTAFQAASTKEQFHSFVKQYPLLKTHTMRDISNRTLNDTTSGKQAIFKLALKSPDNAMTCTVIMVEENGQWKVQRVDVP